MEAISKKEQLRRKLQALYQRDVPVSKIAQMFGLTQSKVVQILGL